MIGQAFLKLKFLSVHLPNGTAIDGLVRHVAISTPDDHFWCDLFHYSWRKCTLKHVYDKGMTITYGAMGTAAAGLLLALASRVVLKQLGASSS